MVYMLQSSWLLGNLEHWYNSELILAKKNGFPRYNVHTVWFKEDSLFHNRLKRCYILLSVYNKCFIFEISSWDNGIGTELMARFKNQIFSKFTCHFGARFKSEIEKNLASQTLNLSALSHNVCGVNANVWKYPEG